MRAGQHLRSERVGQHVLINPSVSIWMSQLGPSLPPFVSIICTREAGSMVATPGRVEDSVEVERVLSARGIAVEIEDVVRPGGHRLVAEDIGAVIRPPLP